MKRISVIGSGSWGTAIASTLADNGHNVILWSYLKEEYEICKKMNIFCGRKKNRILNQNSINYL